MRTVPLIVTATARSPECAAAQARVERLMRSIRHRQDGSQEQEAAVRAHMAAVRARNVLVEAWHMDQATERQT